MKETIKINLNQRLFDLDADAFEKLKDYLDSLKAYFQRTSEEAEEILQDIEQRIAELLQDKLDATKQVVTLSDIDEVIQLMGTEDDFAREAAIQEDEETFQNESKEEESATAFNKQHRRLHRDLDNNILGGVCSGIASYFNIDTVWIRLAFLILLFFNGFGFLAYIIMWIVVPGARTTAQKLQMKGKAVTIDNIQQSVKNEFTKVKDNFSNYSKSESYKKAQHSAAEAFTVIGNVLLVFFKIILVIIGIAFAIAGIVFIISLVSVVAVGGSFFNWNISELPFREFIIPLTQNFSLFGIALSLVILIPVVAIIIGIFRLILNVKSHNSVLSAFAWTFWVLALVFVIVSVASGEKFVSYSYKYKENKKVDISPGKILYIEMVDENRNRHGIDVYTIFGKEIIHNDYKEVCYIRPSIEFKSANIDKPEIEIQHSVGIPSFDKDDLEDMDYSWQLNDTILLLDEFFSVDEEDIWQLPGMKITIYIPEKQKFIIDSDIKRLIKKELNEYSISESDYNSVMIMKDGQLERAEK